MCRTIWDVSLKSKNIQAVNLDQIIAMIHFNLDRNFNSDLKDSWLLLWEEIELILSSGKLEFTEKIKQYFIDWYSENSLECNIKNLQKIQILRLNLLNEIIG